jgi:Xaa-Pro aminopeptidase
MTSGWGQLAAPPTGAGWEFPAEEYRRRVEGARTRMAALGLDCLFLTGEKNIRYLTGFHTQIWVSPTRPRYVILPLEEKPVAIAPSPTCLDSGRQAGSPTTARGRLRGRRTTA